MPDWAIEKYSVTGEGAFYYTYSYPNQALYVMVPDDYSMETAKEEINNVLGIENN